jgi:uncharacterized protein DUF4391
MMSSFSPSKIQRIAFPPAASFDRVVAKEKIIKMSGATSAIKKLLQEQVERVRCSYELAEEKLNLKASRTVPKILIIQVFLKTENLDQQILKAIDKAFGVPIFFELIRQNQCAYAGCFRRRNESDKSKWVFSDYFFSDWVAADSKQNTLPVVLSLGALYEQLIRLLIPFPIRQDEPIDELVARIERIKTKENEADRLSSRLKKEKQFNRKVEINAELRNVKREIETLKI